MERQLSLFELEDEKLEEVPTQTVSSQEEKFSVEDCGIKQDTPERRKLFAEQNKECLEKYPYCFVEYNPQSGNYFMKFNKKKWEQENLTEKQRLEQQD